MNYVFRLVSAWVLFSLTVTNTAHSETLTDLAQKTHFHGISFVRSGSAVLLIATHHGLFSVGKDGKVSLVSQTQDYMGFSPDPSDPLSYYASGHPTGGGNSGFLKSRDGGGTWTQISLGAGGPVDFHQMDVSPVDSKTIYGGFGELQVSKDGGLTWSVVGPLPPGLLTLAASSHKAERVFAATQQGLYVSDDAGVSFQLSDFIGEIVSTIKMSSDGSLIAFVIGRGLVTSPESKTYGWLVLSNDFGDEIPLHIAVDPGDPQHLAITTQKNSVLESTDGGSTWKTF